MAIDNRIDSIPIGEMLLPETATASRRDQKMRTRMPELTPKGEIAPKVNWGQY